VYIIVLVGTRRGGQNTIDPLSSLNLYLYLIRSLSLFPVPVQQKQTPARACNSSPHRLDWRQREIPWSSALFAWRGEAPFGCRRSRLKSSYCCACYFFRQFPQVVGVTYLMLDVRSVIQKSNECPSWRCVRPCLRAHLNSFSTDPR